MCLTLGAVFAASRRVSFLMLPKERGKRLASAFEGGKRLICATCIRFR
jgi:hypothetical protein